MKLSLSYNMRSGNPLLSHLRAELKDLSKKVHFEGNAKPSIPINWRFAESISALKGLKATMIKLLVHIPHLSAHWNPDDVLSLSGQTPIPGLVGPDSRHKHLQNQRWAFLPYAQPVAPHPPSK
ncbi:hypothetical protein EYZ11_010256 [Aspergillus tanneri]|uniref:Uncharacterized protein n=1 Tax=Aspergillus tanneri TaxID=1220188 RepID=A0A4S3J5T9_9EURO|nr:hypothetical protein EYZ11_010256 [Aspergillus tanneri]